MSCFDRGTRSTRTRFLLQICVCVLRDVECNKVKWSTVPKGGECPALVTKEGALAIYVTNCIEFTTFSMQLVDANGGTYNIRIRTLSPVLLENISHYYADQRFDVI